MIVCKFSPGDYITNRKSKDIGIYKSTDAKGYMHFVQYLSGFFGTLKDCTKHTVHVCYQDFYELCNSEEMEIIDKKVRKC